MSRHSDIFRFDRVVLERVIYSPGIYMPPHTDKLSRISIILDGAMNEIAGDHDIAATAGCLVIKPNHAVHENMFGNQPVRLLTIGFEDDSLFAKYFSNWQFINHPRIYVQAIRMWTTLLHIKNQDELAPELNNLSSMALSKYAFSRKAFFWMEELKRLLAQDLSESENIGHLSKKLSLHRVYMARAFKRTYGVSPVEYRKYSKIAAAFLDLFLTKKSLAAIAYDTGFSDQSHMTRAFRLHAGCSPGELRQIMAGN